jgi:nucleotide-binding universal stress UspA family protein
MSERSFFSGDKAQMILHPTDLSEDSQLAFAHALRLAVHNRAFLSLLHVSDEGSAPQLHSPANRRWKCTHVARVGRPTKEILRTAEELSANLIIMVAEGLRYVAERMANGEAQREELTLATELHREPVRPRN